MKLPLTLYLYIGRQFLLAVLYALLALTVITFLIDAIELLRRAAGKDNIPIGILLQMLLLKTPKMAEKLSAYAVLIGSMFALAKLTRSHELIIARAAGVSVWQFLAPALGVVTLLGMFLAFVFNPLASVMLLNYEKLEGKYFSGRPSLMSISQSGLWMRQVENKNLLVSEHIINATRLAQSDMSFEGVIIFTFDRNNQFLERRDVERAVLEKGALHLYGVTLSKPGKPPEFQPEAMLATDLKIEEIHNSFATPDTISFWQLPGFIGVLEKAGFPALRHQLYLQHLFANPFLFCGMVLIAAIFSLRMPRRGRIGLYMGAGMLSGLVLYTFTDIIGAMGLTGNLPVLLAAWAPAAIILMIGAGTLLHMEDG